MYDMGRYAKVEVYCCSPSSKWRVGYIEFYMGRRSHETACLSLEVLCVLPQAHYLLQ